MMWDTMFGHAALHAQLFDFGSPSGIPVPRSVFLCSGLGLGLVRSSTAGAAVFSVIALVPDPCHRHTTYTQLLIMLLVLHMPQQLPWFLAVYVLAQCCEKHSV